MKRTSWTILAMAIGLASAGAGAACAGTSRPLAPLLQGLGDCPGGFTLPGTAGCVRLGGSVTAETSLSTGTRHDAPARHGLAFSQTARAHVSADVRIPTELGPLRAYTSIRVIDATGRPFR